MQTPTQLKLRADYINSAEVMHTLIAKGDWSEYTDRIAVEFRRASDAYHQEKYKMEKR
jgi:hypothetical protein